MIYSATRAELHLANRATQMLKRCRTMRGIVSRLHATVCPIAVNANRDFVMSVLEELSCHVYDK